MAINMVFVMLRQRQFGAPGPCAALCSRASIRRKIQLENNAGVYFLMGLSERGACGRRKFNLNPAAGINHGFHKNHRLNPNPAIEKSRFAREG
jgi:hypothetical protein